MQLNRPSVDEIKILSHVQEQPCLTVTLPTEGANADGRQGTVRMKNLLRLAEDALDKTKFANGSRDMFLQPLRAMAENVSFWRSQEKGLAIFISPGLDGGEARAYSTPYALPEEITLGHRFHLTPLLPFMTSDGTFFVLAVGKKGVTFFRGSRGDLTPLDVPGMPDSFEDVEKYFEHERQHHFSPGSQGRAPGGISEFSGHGLDASDRDEIKRRVVLYLRQIDNAIKQVLGTRRDPLVLVALEYMHPLWREACTYHGCLEEAGVHTDPEILSAKEVYELVWPNIEPVLRQSTEDAVSRLNSGINSGKATAEIKDVLPAAAEGRVDTLLVAENAHRPVGSFDANSRKLKVERELPPRPTSPGSRPEEQVVGPDSEDLIDVAVIETLKHGGQVLAVPPGMLPREMPIAAVFRY